LSAAARKLRAYQMRRKGNGRHFMMASMTPGILTKIGDLTNKTAINNAKNLQLLDITI
jgi:hypothetical protein